MGDGIEPSWKAQTEAQPTVPPSNPMMGYLFSFIFFLQVRTQHFFSFSISQQPYFI